MSTIIYIKGKKANKREQVLLDFFNNYDVDYEIRSIQHLTNLELMAILTLTTNGVEDIAQNKDMIYGDLKLSQLLTAVKAQKLKVRTPIAIDESKGKLCIGANSIDSRRFIPRKYRDLQAFDARSRAVEMLGLDTTYDYLIQYSEYLGNEAVDI